jgi:hypothetical protein
MDPRFKPRGAGATPKKKVPPFGGTLFALEVTSVEVASELTATLALLTGILALAVRILLLLSGLLAAALLLLAGFLSRILILLARLLVLIRHRDLPGST